MCITSTARRRSLNIQVLPSHLLTTSAAKSAEPSTKPTAILSKSDFYFGEEKVQKDPKSTSRVLIASEEPTYEEEEWSHNHQVVKHDYHDHSTDPVVDPAQIKHKAKGGVITPFPVKLHEMLDQIEADGLAHVVSWQPHGRCFVVHKPKEFVNHVMPKYFKQTKMASFQRQLNLYGFNRLTGGLDKGGYYHELFLRGKVSLAYDINRMRVKGTGVRLPTNPDNEPNFYALQPVTKSDVSTPNVVSNPSISGLNTNTRAKPVKKSFNLTDRRNQLRRESLSHSKKINATNSSAAPVKQEDDVVFFEGQPFHYLDPSALAPVSASFEITMPPLEQYDSMALKRPALVHSTSTVVSDSEDDSESFIPSFSAASMDWEGPLSSLTLQANPRRSSFQYFPQDTKDRRPLDDDIETFFQRFEMPVDHYHEQIERMCEDDDTAFGYLLEQAISE